MPSKRSTVQSITCLGRSGNDLYLRRRSHLSIRTGFLQIRKFPYAMRTTLGRVFRKREASDGSLTPFQAVCTALAPFGTGNIAGVAGAIAIGGPGAVFWMWISALLGMCTKFAEVTLAVHFRRAECTRRPCRRTDVLHQKRFVKKMALACRFIFHLRRPDRIRHRKCHSGQHDTTAINSALLNFHIIDQDSVSTSNLILGILIAVVVGLVLLEDQADRKRDRKTRSVHGALLYYTRSRRSHYELSKHPCRISFIISGAFHPSAVTGGVVGSMFLSMKKGCPAVFSPIRPDSVPVPSPMHAPTQRNRSNRDSSGSSKSSWIPSSSVR